VLHSFFSFRPFHPASYPGLCEHAVLLASLHNICGFSALFRVSAPKKKLQAFPDRFRVGRVTHERALPLYIHEPFILQSCRR